ncbi:MAG: DUF4397 domain-containing protein, partial [Schleiferiaceae bacterium]|nr:DUF4397 domain-containing protein [Schleiferiaceae bacterium]
MKKLFFAMAFVAIGWSAQAQTARVQVIHNAADLAAATVDVWLNDSLLLPSFNFRSASPFVDAPAGMAFDISIQPPNSTDTAGALFRQSYTLVANETYIIVANGIISSTGYATAPNFDLSVFTGAREQANSPTSVDLLVFHGATDAPNVDVNEISVLVPGAYTNLAYGNFEGYDAFVPLDYIFEINVAGTSNTVGVFDAPLQTLNLDGEAVVVLASGFADPAANSNGAAFGLLAVLADGTTTLLP